MKKLHSYAMKIIYWTFSWRPPLYSKIDIIYNILRPKRVYLGGKELLLEEKTKGLGWGGGRISPTSLLVKICPVVLHHTLSIIRFANLLNIISKIKNFPLHLGTKEKSMFLQVYRRTIILSQSYLKSSL